MPSKPGGKQQLPRVQLSGEGLPLSHLGGCAPPGPAVTHLSVAEVSANGVKSLHNCKHFTAEVSKIQHLGAPKR